MTNTYTVHPELLAKTADELNHMAAECNRRSVESFDRCDTDGFLSQWASDTTARLYRHAAALAENGWVADDEALFDLDGNLLPARKVSTVYGTTWVYDDEDGDAVWVSISTARSPKRARAHYEKKGVRLGRITRRVVPVMFGSGTGLSGQAWPGHITDRDFSDVEIVSADELAEAIAAGVTDLYDYSDMYEAADA